MKTRFKALICNMVIICLSVLSITSYFFLPFWKVEISFAVSAESIQYFTEGEESEEEGEPTPSPEEEGEAGSMEDFFSIENIGNYIGDEKIPVKLSIALETSYILSSYQADANATVQKIIDDNIDNLVDQVYTPLNKLLKNAVTSISKATLKEQAKEQLKNVYGDEKSDAELEQILIDANVDVDGKVDDLMEKLYADDATVESVSNSIVSTIDEICDELYTYDPEEFADLQLDEEAKTEIKAGVEEMLVTFSNEDGSINMDDFIAEMLLKFLNPEGSEEGEGSEESQSSNVRFMSARFFENENPASSAEGDAKEQLKTELRAYITEMIPEGTVGIVVTVMQIIGYVIFFTFFTWFYLILKILVKIGMKNNAIRLGLPIWLGWLPYLVLVILPSAALSVLKNPSTLSFLGEEVAKGLTTATEAMNAFSLEVSFFSCALVSLIVAIAFLLFSIIYYGPLRRRLKKIKRGLIVEENNEPKETPNEEPEREFEVVVKKNNANLKEKINDSENAPSKDSLNETKQ